MRVLERIAQFGKRELNVARSPLVTFAVNRLAVPASTALASVPSISVMVSDISSCAPLPPPLSL